MLIRTPADVPPSSITPVDVFRRRRALLRTTAALGALNAAGVAQSQSGAQGNAFGGLVKSALSTNEAPTPLKDVIAKTRFRELEEDIAANAAQYSVRPWTVRVEGEVGKPRTFDIEELMKLAPIEERIYRMRCTEGWSLVIPYNGYPLSEILRRVEPNGNAKFVEFTSIHDPAKLRGQRDVNYISWPYVEGLRLDEAMHPLTIVALGVYGELLPKANGAPLAIRVPWKYGIKSPKAVVRIRLTATQPVTVWNKHYPQYHSFWSNVNPNESGGGRSRAHEVRAGDFLRRPTLMLNGYADRVAGLYAGMDPKQMY